MLLTVVTNIVDATILGVSSEIRNVNFIRIASHKSLEFSLIEHGQPHGLDDLAKSFQKRFRDMLGLSL